MKPISELTPCQAAGVRYALMDIDDTLTRRGKLLACAFAALWKLKAAGLKVIPVTGRSAGWCDCIARQWPVDGIIGENGALAFWEEPFGAAGSASDDSERLPALKAMYHPNAVRNDHPALKRVRERAFAEVPGLRDARDQFTRQFDIALDFAEEEPVLPLSEAEKARGIALEEGAMAKVSSIHVNVWMGKYDKLSMAERFLKERFSWQGDLSEVIFAGDSPNDEPMFARFPLACAVANFRRFRDIAKCLPAFISQSEGGEGFAEIADRLIAGRQQAAAGG
ncbi:MAG: HAD-IIB family hydrolase [Treponema sp.]|nr:HAD-IIB family hydrolase [Treponema sp.]